MIRAIFLVFIFAISALAENMVWKGKALGYKDQAAELYVGLDGFNDLETAVQVGQIESNGRFSFTLPLVLPEETLTRPEIREDCGEVTPGLKLGVVASVLVKTRSGIIGEMHHANRATALEDISTLKPEQASKLTAWFYANRNGKLSEDCTEENIRQISKVVFQKGWNVLTAYYLQKGEKLTVDIRNGYSEGLQRWYYLPQKPDPEMP